MEKIKFDDFIKLNRGFDLPDSQIVDGIFPVIASTSIKAFHNECITISARGTVGFVCIHKVPFVPIVRLLAVIPNNSCVHYLYYASKHNDLEGNGTSQQQLTKPMIAKRKIIIPDNNILNQFEDKVAVLYRQIENLKKQNHHLSKQRDLLLPRLMSGKLQVKA